VNTDNVRLELGPELVGRRLLEGPERVVAGVVDHDVETAAGLIKDLVYPLGH